MSKISKQITTSNHKDGIIRFDWMGYPVIGLPHFELRRAERLAFNPTCVCSKYFDCDESLIKFCFDLLKEKKEEMELDIAANLPKRTVFVVGFETDDFDERGKNPLWFFIVFSIDVKLSEMNGVNQGDTSVNLISTGIFPFKNRTVTEPDTIEVVIGYHDNGDGFQWTKQVPR